MAQVNSTDIVAHQVDYSKFNYDAPYYKYTRLHPMSGSQDVTFGPTDQQESIIEIPAKVFNPGRSVLSFTDRMLGHVGKMLWQFNDVVRQISQIQLMTRGGQILSDSNFLQNHSKAVRKRMTKLQQYLSNDEIDGLTSNQIVLMSGTTPITHGKLVGGTVGNTPYLRDGIPNTGERTFHVGLVANTATPIKRFQYRLSDICKDTPLGEDKDYYASGEALILRILWGPGSKMAFGSDASDLLTNPVPNTLSNTEIKKITLMLAVQSNDTIASDIRSKALSPEGYSVLVPYTHANKLNLQSAGSHNITIRMNRVHGRSLIKCTVAPFHAIESGVTAYDNSNTTEQANAQKISSYYTSLDSNKIQEFDIDCTAAQNRYDDWLLQKDMLEGSMIQNRDHYYSNWSHCDDFTHIHSVIDPKLPVSKDNLLIGLPLDVEKRYDFTANANATLNYYTWTVTQRLLVFQPNNVRIE